MVPLLGPCMNISHWTAICLWLYLIAAEMMMLTMAMVLNARRRTCLLPILESDFFVMQILIFLLQCHTLPIVVLLTSPHIHRLTQVVFRCLRMCDNLMAWLVVNYHGNQYVTNCKWYSIGSCNTSIPHFSCFLGCISYLAAHKS